MFRRKVKTRGGDDSTGLTRMLLSVMGPPQIGPFDEGPPPEVPDETCRRCHRPLSEHEVVREPRLTWTRCPS